MIHKYNGMLLNHKNEWNKAICSNMDGLRDYHSKWSKLENMTQMNLIYEIERDSQ